MRPDDRSATDLLSAEIGGTLFVAPDDPAHMVGRVGLGGTFYYRVPSTVPERQAMGRFLDDYVGRFKAHLSWFGLPLARRGAFKAVSPHRAPKSMESSGAWEACRLPRPPSTTALSPRCPMTAES